MRVKKKVILALSILFSVFLIWYFFIKQNDYTISFKVKAATGTVFQGIQEWANIQSQKGNEKYNVIDKRNFDFVKLSNASGKNHLEYTWDIVPLNDSVTKVNVGIKELGHGFYNKITAPFFNTKFKEDQIDKITSFKDGLNDHLKKFKIKIDGVGSSKEVFVAYISLNSVLQTKAQTLIANNAVITGFLYENNIKIKGRPYIEITKWDMATEALEFNYCFPIDPNTKIVKSDVVKFKTIPELKGLTATYYGNMRTSDRSWFALLDFAKRNGYEVLNQPLENYLNNPFNGGEELTWETKVIVPFKKQ